MNYRARKKIKIIKEYINNLKFKYINLSIPKQITLFGSLIGIISLFSPWIIHSDNNISWNSFNPIAGNIGYLLLIIYLLPMLMVLSNNYKEKIKLYSDLNFRTHFIIINSGLITISFSIISLSFAIGLATLGQNIIHGNGPILSMTAGIIILVGGFFIRKEFKKSNSEIILEKLSQNREKTKEINNMELPF